MPGKSCVDEHLAPTGLLICPAVLPAFLLSKLSTIFVAFLSNACQGTLSPRFVDRDYDFGDVLDYVALYLSLKEIRGHGFRSSGAVAQSQILERLVVSPITGLRRINTLEPASMAEFSLPHLEIGLGNSPFILDKFSLLSIFFFFY